MSGQIGKVYLVGAGPGDPGLITVRGRQLLDGCDVVVYDALIPPELIVTVPPTVERIYVGKKAGRHSLPQDEINALLVTLARAGKKVVRLKGADPLVFGRGGEEARHLREHDVPFEIVPGVTAAVGAGAYAGIPQTDRRDASFVTYATGHKAGDKLKSSVPWEQLAQLTGGTLVIYMGVGEAAALTEKLVASGMPPETPAAVIERGTVPSQRVFTTNLVSLPETIAQESVQPPAILVIGAVTRLREHLGWFPSGPLAGKRVMVLRPADQAADAYRRLRELGAEVLPYPTIATEPRTDSVAWTAFAELSAPVRWLVFTSENGVRYFAEQYLGRHRDLRGLAGFSIAAVGVGTARALQKYHLRPDFLPETATVAALAEAMADKYDLAGAEVVRVQGTLSDDTIFDRLTDAGAAVLPLTVYHTFTPLWPEDFGERLKDHPPDAVLFTSGSTVRGLFELLSPADIKRLLAQSVLASIGPMTSRTIRSHGLEVHVEAKQYSVPGLIEALADFYANQTTGQVL